MTADSPSRDDIAEMYFESLPFDPYPVQEEALLSWFSSEQGVLVCAPTGTGKTLIAEAAMFEALHDGSIAYYTTPLIALTDQKFEEMQDAAERWGFSRDDVGLVTGNRKINPDARILVVVAEILLNRLLHAEAFDFDDVSAVVMDEFHSFNDRERGIVWEFGLGMLPAHVRTLLLSATVGNSRQFVNWLEHRHQRKIDLVEGTERKVPLTFQWVGDELLIDHIEKMAAGDDEARTTPTLLFCFNREQCWNYGEQLRGRTLLQPAQRDELLKQVNELDWSHGVGTKLKAIVSRGIGIHHAGLLPKYRRIVEDLFQQKLLPVCVCTETLAAGINLPARSVVLPELLKGPRDDKKLMDASGAHQMFGRAGRPQFDDRGYVFALAHEDDVKIDRWREKYDAIPDDTKDPGLRKAKKALKKKMPKRRSTQAYWNEQQFIQLRDASPGDLASRGPLPWRLMAYMLDASPDVAPLRELVSKRLFFGKDQENAQKDLDRMLQILWRGGYVELEPSPIEFETEVAEAEAAKPKLITDPTKLFHGQQTPEAAPDEKAKPPEPPHYEADFAYPTEQLSRLLHFRSVNPLYGVFLINQLGIADGNERLQAMESVLEMPGSVARSVRVPRQEELPPGPLARNRVDSKLLQLGLATAEQLGAKSDEDEEEKSSHSAFYDQADRVWVLTLADKLKMLFDHDFPGVHGVRITPVWAAGELLEWGGDFDNYIKNKRLAKQEGIIFRHLLRMILLTGEFRDICPPESDPDEWRDYLDDIADRLTVSCRAVDPLSTDKVLESLQQPPVDT